MDDIIRDFISEANESIEVLDRALVRFEREPSDPDLLSEIFRVMHTIKGTCGFLGLQRLAAIAHAGENILGRFRDGELTPAQDSVSAVLDAVDLIKVLVAQLETSGAESAGCICTVTLTSFWHADRKTVIARTNFAYLQLLLSIGVICFHPLHRRIQNLRQHIRVLAPGLRGHMERVIGVFGQMQRGAFA